MTTFLIYILKVGGWTALFYMFYRLLLQKETFHRLNRVVLLVTAVLSFVLPFCIITFHENIEMAVPVVQSTATVAAEVAEIPSIPWWITVGTILYWTGFAFVLGRTLYSIYQVRCLISESELHHQTDGTRIAVADKPIPPSSWYKTVILSRKDFEENDAAILAHERGHIAHRHTVDVVLTDILTAFQWFNPAIWMLRLDLRAIHEYQADEAVLSKGINARQYQYLLIRKATGIGGYSAANSFNHSTLKNRITMMLKSKSSDKRTYKALFVLPIIALALAVNARTVTDITYLPVNEDSNVKETKQSIMAEAAQATTIEEAKAIIDETSAVEQSQQDDQKKLLYIVDGVEVKSIDDINPDDIASVNILKGESATAIYGERGANGVVMITMKAKTEDDKTVDVKGTVYDAADGLPLVGTAIKVIGSNKGTVADVDGDFELSGVKPSDKLEISYIGYASEIVLVPANGKSFKVMMKKDNSDKKEVAPTKNFTPSKSGKTNGGGLDNVFIDGKKVAKEDLNKIDPNTIKEMRVEKGKDGSSSILITLKK